MKTTRYIAHYQEHFRPEKTVQVVALDGVLTDKTFKADIRHAAAKYREVIPRDETFDDPRAALEALAQKFEAKREELRKALDKTSYILNQIGLKMLDPKPINPTE